jgi:hypothetical protein
MSAPRILLKPTATFARSTVCHNARRTFSCLQASQMSSKRKMQTSTAYQPYSLDTQPPPPRNAGIPRYLHCRRHTTSQRDKTTKANRPARDRECTTGRTSIKYQRHRAGSAEVQAHHDNFYTTSSEAQTKAASTKGCYEPHPRSCEATTSNA